MPRPNPNIPLQSRTNDFSAPLSALVERRRQTGIDDLNQRATEADIEQRRSATAVNNAKLNAPSEASQNARLNAAILDTMAISDMLGQHLDRNAIDPVKAAEILKQAGGLGIGIRDNMVALGMPTERLERTLTLMIRDPAGAKRFLDDQVLPGLRPLLEEFSDDVFDSQGNIIGQRSRKTNEFKPITQKTEESNIVPDSDVNSAGQVTIQTAPGVFEAVPVKGFEGSTDENVRTRKIQNVLSQVQKENPEMSGEDALSFATNIVDGLIRTEANPVTGVVETTSQISQSVAEVSRGDSPPPADVPPADTIFAAIGQGTGLFSAVSSGISQTVGQVIPQAVNESVIDARERLELAINPLVEAFRVTQRIGSQEVARIQEMANIQPSVFGARGVAETRAIRLDRTLRIHLSQAVREANDEGAPQSARGSARQDATAIQNFLSQLGAPQRIDISIINAQTIQELGVEDLKRFVIDHSEEELDSLGDELLTLLIDRTK